MPNKLAPLLAATLLCACAHADTSTSTISWVVEAEAAARSEALTAEDIVLMKQVADVELSPDGKLIAHVLRVPSPLDEPGRAHSQIWLVDAAGKHPPRRLTAEGHSSSSPRWSPDGRRIAFLGKRGKDAYTQIYVMPIDGGEPELLFEATSSIRRFEWSPDGKHVAYAIARETAADKKEREAGRDWVVDEAGGTKTRLFVYTLATEESRELVTSGENVLDFEWSPKGDRLAVRASERATIDHAMMYSSLYTVAAAGGGLEPLTKTAGKLGHMAWSPNGEQLAFLGAADIHDSTAGIVHVVAAAGGEARALTAELEATGTFVDWTDDNTVVFLASQGTKTTINTLAVASGAVKTVIDSGPICHDLSLGSRGALACAGDTSQHPREVFSGALETRRLARVTVANPSLLTRTLGAQEVVSWKAEDGLELEGVLIKPVGYEAGTRYPLAVLPHGGPEGISLNGWTTRATYPAQLFATRGYVVFMPNYRGSAGRGTEFATADHQDLGGKEFGDVLAGIDHLVAQGLVDPERVGMGGWSYGGYFSALAATTYSERFRAAMIAAAITNWISFTGTTEIEHENSLVHWKLWPWDDMELPWERSPLAHIEGSQTASLIVHGLADTRVPTGQSLELYRGLRHLGVDTQLVMYPREGHGIGENVHSLDFVNRWLDWFDEHVKSEGD
ncbi:Prolyl tripeptidyl peptidase precursor [Enhygromyxa salina]|uniref:Prolyl tripeptidyl peptidase n=1 Tax=Enhygromyxa salina TaxID=215803 RepID=A0A2S9YE74_9BACT|nr:S9 family peptidase [Enhygromyxa salina]PRQ03428.1 Prolyl tripeptidyl peptidase precursor [Enhygromyxa salina]